MRDAAQLEAIAEDLAEQIKSDYNADEALQAYDDYSREHELPSSDDQSRPPAKRFEFVQIGEMVAQLRPINWLIRDYVEQDAVINLYGAPGGGKTQVATSLACCVASGSAWFGKQTQSGAVFYLAGEGHNGLARRFTACSQELGVSLENAPLYVSRTSAALTDPLATAQVTQAVEDLANVSSETPALIVIDTLARNFGAADENSTSDMNRFIAHIDALRRRWGCTVLIVHHSGKDGSRGARGSTVLRGAVDAEFEVSRDDAGLVRLKCHKMKDAEMPEPLAFTIEGVKLPIVDDDGEPVFGPVLRAAEYTESTRKRSLSQDEQIALKHLTEDWKPFVVWRDDWFFDAAEVVSLKGKNKGQKRQKDYLRTAFKRTLNSLVEKGLIEQNRINDDTGGNVRLARDSEE